MNQFFLFASSIFKNHGEICGERRQSGCQTLSDLEPSRIIPNLPVAGITFCHKILNDTIIILPEEYFGATPF